ncbi:MAG TPA: MarR family transcriptional regulator [Acidimicrobiales bacterium]|nr:MarR family transcriptional regulator [Acidimicrobiales bacterium]
MSTAGLGANRAPSDDWRLHFVEEMASLLLVHGTPRAVMRVLGWMIVCESPEQTGPRIQEALGLSAGSVSTSLRTLTEVGVLERVARPGDRRIYYRLCPQGWERVLKSRFRAFTELRQVAERALDAAGDGADDRLVWMRNTYALMETGVKELLRVSLERNAGVNAGATAGTTPLRRH